MMSGMHMKVEDEFARNPDLKKEDLVELRQWLRTQEHLPSITEEDLIYFLHSCYYDVDNTKDCIEKYHHIRATTPELFTKRDFQLPENQKMLSVLNYAELPVKDPNGYHILFHSLKQTEPSKYMFADAARVYLMMLEICVKHEGPSPGIVAVFDLTGVRLMHLTRVNLSLTRKFIMYVQEGLPVRLKAVHVLNVMPVIDHIMTLVKPFLNKELLKLIHFHKGNNESVYEYLPKNCLPKDFGGELPTVAELDGAYAATLPDFNEYFKEADVIENERSHRGRSLNDDVPQSALRSLVID